MGKVIIKTASTYRLEHEREVLKCLHGQPSIRPLVDEILEPPCLVLKFLDDHSLNASNQNQLKKSEVKFVAKKVLEALDALHTSGYVHTGKFIDSNPGLILAR